MSSALFQPGPTSTDWLRQGRLALRQGRPTEARHAILAALAVDPGNEQAWVQLSRLSSPRARLAYLTRALELNPANPRAHQELRRARRASTVPAFHAQSLAGSRLWPIVLLLLVSVVGLGGLATWLQFTFTFLPQPPHLAALSLPIKLRLTATPTHTPVPTYTSTPLPAPTETSTATPTSEATMEAGRGSLPEAVANDERWIDVNLTTQTLTAFAGAAPIQTFVVSTGVWQYPTVTGEYRIYVKYPAADMAGPGYYLPAVPYVMYFYEGYGLHGTYWHNNFGTPMSHGCVNLRTDEAAWLFEWASVGTVVNVHY